MFSMMSRGWMAVVCLALASCAGAADDEPLDAPDSAAREVATGDHARGVDVGATVINGNGNGPPVGGPGGGANPGNGPCINCLCVSCWDLDGDHTCSPGEDVDGSGTCDAGDCIGEQGPAGPQGLQ